jgi:hypothetical protein
MVNSEAAHKRNKAHADRSIIERHQLGSHAIRTRIFIQPPKADKHFPTGKIGF